MSKKKITNNYIITTSSFLMGHWENNQMLPILTAVKRQTVSIHCLAVYCTAILNTSGRIVVLLGCCEVGRNVTGILCLESNYQHLLVQLVCGLRDCSDQSSSHSAALRPLLNILINILHIEIEYRL